MKMWAGNGFALMSIVSPLMAMLGAERARCIALYVPVLNLRLGGNDENILIC